MFASECCADWTNLLCRAAISIGDGSSPPCSQLLLLEAPHPTSRSSRMGLPWMRRCAVLRSSPVCLMCASICCARHVNGQCLPVQPVKARRFWANQCRYLSVSLHSLDRILPYDTHTLPGHPCAISFKRKRQRSPPEHLSRMMSGAMTSYGQAASMTHPLSKL